MAGPRRTHGRSRSRSGSSGRSIATINRKINKLNMQSYSGNISAKEYVDQRTKLEAQKTQLQTKKPVITIVARRWFDRKNGNTYHSVKVYADGKFVGEEPYEYGYGEQYKQTAHRILQEKGIYPKTGKRLSSGMDADYYEFMMDQRENRDRFVIDVSDVSRKKDL